MGRTAHIFSAVKVPLLTDAMERFQAAYESLPDTIPAPVLNPNETYSPVTFLHSPTLSARSSSSAVVRSPALSPDHGMPPVSNPSPISEALSVQNLSVLYAKLAHTPPPPVPSPSRASSSSITRLLYHATSCCSRILAS